MNENMNTLRRERIHEDEEEFGFDVLEMQQSRRRARRIGSIAFLAMILTWAAAGSLLGWL